MLVAISVTKGESIFKRDEPIEHVLFPTSSIISVILETAGGDIAEVGIIGREGMSGVPLALGHDRAQQHGLVQVSGRALSMAAAKFREALSVHPDLLEPTLNYAHAQLTSNAHISACNTLHAINARCARWLLLAHDRVDGDTYFLTHEFLSEMLGVRRSSVTAAASALQQAGYIAYARGRITILNRAGLESMSCECYGALERDLKKLMGYSPSKTAETIAATRP